MNIKDIENTAYKMLGGSFFRLVKKSKAQNALKYVLEQTDNLFGKEKQDIFSSFNKKLSEKDSFIATQKEILLKEKNLSQIHLENVNSVQMGLRYLNKLLKSRIKLGDASVIEYSKNIDTEYVKIKQMKMPVIERNNRIIGRLLNILKENPDKHAIKIQDEKTGNTKYRIYPSYDDKTKELKHVSIYKLNPNKQEPVHTSEYHISFKDGKVTDVNCILGNPSEYTLFKDLDSDLKTQKLSFRNNDKEYAQIEYV